MHILSVTLTSLTIIIWATPWVIIFFIMREWKKTLVSWQKTIDLLESTGENWRQSEIAWRKRFVKLTTPQNEQ